MDCLNCQKLVEDIDHISECEQCNKQIPLCEECEDNNDIYDKYFVITSYINSCRNCYSRDDEIEDRKRYEERQRKDEEIRKQNNLINEQKNISENEATELLVK